MTIPPSTAATTGYAAICPECAGWVLLISDRCGREEVAKEIAQCIREGYEAQRISKADVMGLEMCPLTCAYRDERKP